MTNYWLEKIRDERIRQEDKWGESNHHPLVWFSIIGEEYGEMCKAFNEYFSSIYDNDEPTKHNRLDDMKTEAIQVAACCVAMLECIDRKTEEGLAP